MQSLAIFKAIARCVTSGNTLCLQLVLHSDYNIKIEIQFSNLSCNTFAITRQVTWGMTAACLNIITTMRQDDLYERQIAQCENPLIKLVELDNIMHPVLCWVHSLLSFSNSMTFSNFP